MVSQRLLFDTWHISNSNTNKRHCQTGSTFFRRFALLITAFQNICQTQLPAQVELHVAGGYAFVQKTCRIERNHVPVYVIFRLNRRGQRVLSTRSFCYGKTVVTTYISRYRMLARFFQRPAVPTYPLSLDGTRKERRAGLTGTNTYRYLIFHLCVICLMIYWIQDVSPSDKYEYLPCSYSPPK